MNRKRWVLRSVSLFLFVTMLITAAFSFTAYADEDVDAPSEENAFTSHDIAIVFDNSGSMYDDTDRWSQAIYAMEVFASMLDYDRDKLTIYPMAPISIGETNDKDGGTDRLVISQKEDVKDIEGIYSPTTQGTTLEPAYNAAKYLGDSELDEKWLIVLTDGEFYYNRNFDDEVDPKAPTYKEWLGETIASLCPDINIQYLGFGEAVALPGDELHNFYATNVNDASALTNALVEICNKIFKRNIVSDVSADGKFKIDVSMNSIIAFIQGENARINKLTGPDGKPVKAAMDTKLDGATTSGTGDDNYPNPKKANVSGHSVTFTSCPAGEYKLDSTASNVQIFYEPAVYVSAELHDAKDEAVDMTQSVYSGDYTLHYKLVDAITGEDIPDEPYPDQLKPVKWKIQVTNNGKTKDNIGSGSEITLDPDSDTVIDVNCTYLDKYTISNAEKNINVVRSPDLDVTVTVTNRNFGRKWYKQSDHEKWEPIRVDVTLNGEPVPDDVLSQGAVFSAEPEDKELPYRAELIPGESAFNVYLGDNGSGEFVKPKNGKYTFTAVVSVPDEKGVEISAKDSDKFEIQSYSSFWRWLIWLVLLVLLTGLILFVLNLPAWPRKMFFVVEKPKVDEGLKATVKIRSTGMPIIPYEDALRCSAAKNSKIKDRLFKPRSMSIVATNFSSEEIRMFKTGGRTYTDSGDGFVCKGAENEIIFNGSQFEFTFLNGSKGSGHIEIH